MEIKEFEFDDMLRVCISLNISEHKLSTLFFKDNTEAFALENNDKEIVGLCVYRAWYKFNRITRIRLKLLVIRERDQRKGFGSILLNQLKLMCTSNECMLSCNVLEENLVFQLFLRENGVRATRIKDGIISFSFNEAIECSGAFPVHNSP